MKIKKILFLNLPHQKKITRRYLCSYFSDISLFPPYELICLAALARKDRIDVSLIDSIAEKLNITQTASKIKNEKPEVIVTITGFESYREDIDSIAILKKKIPNITFIVIGHYPTIFPQETLVHSAGDYVIRGEPDKTFSLLIKYLNSNKKNFDIKGLAYKNGDNFHLSDISDRIENLSDLPMPAYDLVNFTKYKEPFMPAPYTLLQTSRGCPYPCAFCVKPYGSKIYYKSPEKVIDEIKFLSENFKIKSLRFIDDNLTTDKKRLKKICCYIIDSELQHIKWACLARIENLTSGLLSIMKEAGCVRIYLGIESASSNILNMLGKNFNLSEAKEKIRLCNQYRIETAGFFMFGFPGERIIDLLKTARFACESDLNFVIPGELKPYPGTEIYKKMKKNIQFSIYPYKLGFTDPYINKKCISFEKKFFRYFYLRPDFFLKNLSLISRYPLELAVYFCGSLYYLFAKKKKLFIRLSD